MPKARRRKSNRDEVIAVDLGSKVTKAVLLRHSGKGIELGGYVLGDGISMEQARSRSSLGAYLRKLLRPLRSNCRRMVLCIGPAASELSHVDLPGASASDLRHMITISPKNYLQKELPGHVFDCHVQEMLASDTPPGGTPIRRKSRVLVGGARSTLVEELHAGVHEAGYVLEELTLSQVAMANALRVFPSIPEGAVVALMDVGFQSTSISVVRDGNILLTRTVAIGSERFNEAAESDTESIDPSKEDLDDVPLGDAFQVGVQRAITSLAREVDASMGFFASQHELHVTRIYVSGGAARSQFVLQTLEAELGLPCQIWRPTEGLALSLGEREAGELDYEAPQLTVAIGAGVGWLYPESIRIDLLAEEREAQAERRTDPVRRARWVAAVILLGVCAWSAWIGANIWLESRQLAGLEREMRQLREQSAEALAVHDRAEGLEAKLDSLRQLGQHRFLMAPTLNALQYLDAPGIHFHRLHMSRQLTQTTTGKANPIVAEKVVLEIDARNYGDGANVPKFLQNLKEEPFFMTNLTANADQAVELLSTGKIQSDQRGEGNVPFILFSVRCNYQEQVYPK